MDPPSDFKETRSSNASGNDPLHLDPGAPHRRTRSVGKLCLWLGILACIGCLGALCFIMVQVLRHPHAEMYHIGPPGPHVPQIVGPLITKSSRFDVIASVWVRDDDASDGFINIDGEDRPERLLYTGTVFRNISLGENPLANVSFRVPTGHFAQANISNYDLRASFVLAQPDLWTWPYDITSYASWRPRGFAVPTVRKWEHRPSLQDRIYDSFGVSVPLLQFQNIASRGPQSDTSSASRNLPEENIEQEEPDWGNGLDVNDEELMEAISEEEDERNLQSLEFTGSRKPITDYHPYIVTRTHLHITDEELTYKKQEYNQAQEELASKTCTYSSPETPRGHPQWYQCFRAYQVTGVFETKIELRIPRGWGWFREDEEGGKMWMYAPYLSTIRAPGPKDLVPIPVDREATAGSASQVLASGDGEYVNVTWKISFSSFAPDILLLKAHGIHRATTTVYNMTMPDNELEYLQHEHDSALGLIGYRLHEDAHPRRRYALKFLVKIGRMIYILSNIHYWHTQVNTAGISRLGTTFIASYFIMDATGVALSSWFRVEATRASAVKYLIVYSFHLITPCLMLLVITRLRFGRPMDTEDPKNYEWVPRVYFAEPTHLERSSDRVEGRTTRQYKLILFVSIFSLLHFVIPSLPYLIAPRVARPATKIHPVHSLFPYAATIMGGAHSLSSSLYVTGSTLQFIMNFFSKTYAGKYKTAAFLWLCSELLNLLDLMPSIVGKAARLDGVLVAETIVLAIAAVDVVQAVMYRAAKTSDVEDTE